MTESAATRAALLARPGEACDRLAAALREAGAEVVLVGDPRSLDPAALRACAPQAVLVALEPAVEDSLDRFEALLHDPTLTVIFDEADLAARREGWDAARWTRHLRAKLHGHDDVLPPGSGAAEVVTDFADSDGDGVDETVLAMLATLDAPPADNTDGALREALPVDAAFDAPLRDSGSESDVRLDESPLELEWTADSDADASDTGVSGIALVGAGELLDSLAEPDSARTDDASTLVVDSTPLALDWSADRDDGDIDQSVGAGTLSLVDAGELLDSLGSTDAVAAAFDGNALDPDLQAMLDSLPDDAGDGTTSSAENSPQRIDAPSLEADVQAMLDSGDEEDSAPDAQPTSPARSGPPLFDSAHMQLDAMAGPEAGDDGASSPDAAAPAAAETVRAEPDFSRFDIGLSLADADAAMPASAPLDADAPGAAKAIDLDALDQRVSALSLVEADSDGAASAVTTPDAAASRGAVVVEAGLGGPDAVRQLLGGLPASFPRPVLVRLQLDGGRYDRLVKQMERASSLPVAIAEDGGYARAGTVYFLPGDIALVQREAGLAFAVQDDAAAWMDALPAADTALLLLSGSDAARVDAALALSAAGALVAGQSADNCYDGRAPGALIAQGAPAGTPTELAARLVARWPF